MKTGRGALEAARRRPAEAPPAARTAGWAISLRFVYDPIRRDRPPLFAPRAAQAGGPDGWPNLLGWLADSDKGWCKIVVPPDRNSPLQSDYSVELF